MKKLCSVLLVLAMLISVIPTVISATEGTPDATPITETISTDHITLGLTATGTENSYTFYQGDAVTREFGNIVLTFSEGCKIYNTETRVYESNSMSIAPKTGYKITSIVLNTTSKKPIGATVHHASTTLTNATTTCASTDTVATLIPVDGTKAVSIQAGTQFRITSLEVTYEAVVIDDTCTHEYTYTYNNDNTHNATCDCGDNTLQNEACVDADSDKKCDLCGGELTDAVVNVPQTETINTNRVVFDLPVTGTENSYTFYQGDSFSREFGNIVLFFSEGCKIYDNEARVYESNSLTIAPKTGYKITSIMITSTTNKPIGTTIHTDATVLLNATTNCITGDATATFIPINGTQEVIIQAGTQFRAKTIVVTYEVATADDLNPPSGDDNQGGNGAITPEGAIGMNTDSFGLSTNKTDSSNTAYYQGQAFSKDFGNYIISFDIGTGEQYPAAYGNEIRVYANNVMTITPKAGYKIESIVAHSQVTKPIGAAITHIAGVVNNATHGCVSSEATATFTPIKAGKAILIKAGTQFRITSLEIVCVEDASDPTGDNTNITLFGMLMVTSLGALAVLIPLKKRYF